MFDFSFEFGGPFWGLILAFNFGNKFWRSISAFDFGI